MHYSVPPPLTDLARGALPLGPTWGRASQCSLDPRRLHVVSSALPCLSEMGSFSLLLRNLCSLTHLHICH